jgi:predicted nuclease with TOPRIM domain
MNRQDLIDYREDKKWLEDRLKEVEERKLLLNKLTATYGDSTGGSNSIQDRIADDLVKLLDMTNDYVGKLVKLQKKLIEIENTIEQMSNKLHRNILYNVYILGNNLTVTSNEINKEYKYTCVLHGRALNEFDKICK